MKRVIMLLIGLFFGYFLYRHFPQKFEIGQCFIEPKTNELYLVLSKAKRDLDFKNHWIFGPMKIEAKLINANPNTLRKSGEHSFFYPSSDDLLFAKCP